MITGKTKLVGIIGWPLGHTLSPAIQNTAFKAAGLDYIYVPLPVNPTDLAAAFSGLKALSFTGVNVTIPHKINIKAYLDKLDRSAEVVGAVNVVVLEKQCAVGYNTDMLGFINSLKAKNVVIDNCEAVLIGAGGAARAIVCGLVENKIAKVTVGARDEVKATGFADSFHHPNQVTGCSWQANSFKQALKTCDILINCTPLGMYSRLTEEVPLDWKALKPQAVVCDLIYNPAVTRFLAQASAAGHKTVGGAGMLVEQGAAAFELWTGKPAPRDVMYQELDRALHTK